MKGSGRTITWWLEDALFISESVAGTSVFQNKHQDTQREREWVKKERKRDGDTCTCQSDTSLQRGTWLPICSLTSSIKTSTLSEPQHIPQLPPLSSETSLPHLITNQTSPFRDSRARKESISVSPYLACTNIKHHKDPIRHHKNSLKTFFVL